MSDEEELRDAAEWNCPLVRLPVLHEYQRGYAIGGGFVGGVWEALSETEQRLRLLQEYVRRELARRVERAKPITDEYFYMATRGCRFIRRHNGDTGELELRSWIVTGVHTQGDLDGVIVALKGGGK